MIQAAISGSNGFIGQHLMKRLKQAEINPVPILRNYLFDIKLLNQFLYEKKIDYIIHLAAYGNHYNQQEDFKTIFSNIMGLANLLEASKGIEYKGFINFSSSSAGLSYETLYSATKGSGERIAKAFVNKYDKPIVSVRPFTVIGKGDNPDHLISKLINSCIEGNHIQFIPHPVHDYIGVSDFCDAILLIMEQINELKGETIDIGTGTQTSNQEILEIVESLTDKPANVNIVEEMRTYDTDKWVANPSRIIQLGWRQNQTIRQIIKEIIG